MASNTDDSVVTAHETTPHETTPLLSNKLTEAPKWGRSVVYRALLCGLMVSLSFGVTQVPLIYVFRVMTCDAYYETHPEPGPGIDRCSNREIESRTALSVSLLGTSTTFFGVMNLFVTNWTIKKFGIKSALQIQVFWPAIRLAVQNVGVMVGSSSGILIIQSSQIITIIGGPAGYLLTLNSYITEIVSNRERTGVLGQLQGCAMFGIAIGYLAGGLISDAYDIAAPFKVTLALFVTSCLYVSVFLPWIPLAEAPVTKAPSTISKFFGPVKIFTPHKWISRDGRIQKEYGTLLLGVGVFFGVLATGYIPVLLQMYSTDVLKFGTRENGFLISLNSLIRGLYLTFAFPRIISAGREWLSHREESKKSQGCMGKILDVPDRPTEQDQFTEVEAIENEDEPLEPPNPSDDKETFEFDLLFTKYSLIADGILTAAACFVREGWQIYLVAVLLPFASGTGSAAKGTILQMCPASDRADALSAITLLEMIARLLTTSIFGLVFAAFASIEKTYLVFVCNGAVAVLGFCFLIFSRFPSEGSQRLSDIPDHNTQETP